MLFWSSRPKAFKMTIWIFKPINCMLLSLNNANKIAGILILQANLFSMPVIWQSTCFRFLKTTVTYFLRQPSDRSNMSRLMTKPTKWLCAQRRLRSAWTFAQSDQNRLRWAAKDPSLSSCERRRLWSDWVDAQADLRLRWAHMAFCWFCHEASHIVFITVLQGAIWQRWTVQYFILTCLIKA